MSPKSDPRAVRTRELIEAAFLALYREKRVKDITVNDITSRAGINRATFYKHYQDKFDLYDQYVKRCFESHLAGYVNKNAMLTKTTFRSLVYATILFILDWQSTRRITPEQTDLIIEAQIQHIVFERIMFWIEPNYLKGPCDAGTEVAATAVSWAIFGIGMRMAQQKTDVPVDDVTDELVLMLSGGLWNTLAQYHAQAAAARD